MIDALSQATFLCALLLFWLCVYHGLRQVTPRLPKDLRLSYRTLPERAAPPDVLPAQGVRGGHVVGARHSDGNVGEAERAQRPHVQPRGGHQTLLREMLLEIGSGHVTGLCFLFADLEGVLFHVRDHLPGVPFAPAAEGVHGTAVDAFFWYVKRVTW